MGYVRLVCKGNPHPQSRVSVSLHFWYLKLLLILESKIGVFLDSIWISWFGERWGPPPSNWGAYWTLKGMVNWHPATEPWSGKGPANGGRFWGVFFCGRFFCKFLGVVAVSQLFLECSPRKFWGFMIPKLSNIFSNWVETTNEIHVDRRNNGCFWKREFCLVTFF